MKYLWVTFVILNSMSAYSASEKSCRNIFDQVVMPYKKLFMKLPKNMLLDSEYDVVRMITMKDTMCDTIDSRKRSMEVVVNGLSEHSARVGVLLPLSGIHARSTSAIVDGMRSVYPYRNISFERRVLLRDTRGIVQSMERHIAELVFKHRISILIGGFSQAEAKALEKWGSRLRIPVLILNKKMSKRTLKQVFHIFPREDLLVDRLSQHVKRSGFKNVALLHPLNTKGRRFTGMIHQNLVNRGIRVDHSYVYSSGDFGSMEAAAKKIFKIDPVERSEEYQELVNKAKEEASEAGLPFNPTLVALSPIIDVDAILIDDNFRTVRHFAKLFKYLGVDKIKLIGTPQWRALGLIDPPDSFMEGASFVDYIGSYRRLPKGIVAPILKDPFFVNPEASSKVDYMVIGHHAIKTADRTLSTPILKRRRLFTRLSNLDLSDDPYFGRGPVFGSDHRSGWPTFLFHVGDGKIGLAPLKRQTNQAKAISRKRKVR